MMSKVKAGVLCHINYISNTMQWIHKHFIWVNDKHLKSITKLIHNGIYCQVVTSTENLVSENFTELPSLLKGKGRGY